MGIKLDDVTITGTLTVAQNAISAQTRSTIMRQDANAIFPVPFTDLRVWDALATVLSGTSAADDLGLITGTFGTAPPTIGSGDVKASTTTRYARFQVALPECYDTGETVSISISAGMVTTVASSSCTLDVECYRLDKDAGIGSDLCSTAAQSINSLVFGDKVFNITSSGLAPGDILDVRITIACVDGATATAVKPTIGAIDLLADIKA